ncbi:MAG: hypothetical protein U5Q03_20555 [Bacteroidota bacterium]|nr:hypothetical protein [Bacteroidota bacterium]
MSGRNGLQLVLTSGKKLLIGTRQPEKVKEAMGKILQAKEQ